MPIDRDELARRLLGTFREELADHLEAIEQALVALEQAPTGQDAAERLRTLLREAHTLKGAARAVGIPAIERACHHMEEAFAQAQAPGAVLGAPWFAWLFRAVDALRQASDALSTTRDLTGTAIAAVADLPAPLVRVAPPPGGAASGAPPTTAPPTGAASGAPARSDVPPASPIVAPSIPRTPTESPPARVPPAPTDPASPRPPPEPTPDPPPLPHEPRAAPDAAVRVPARKLDALLMLGGELALARRRAAARREDAVTAHQDATRLSREIAQLGALVAEGVDLAKAPDLVRKLRATSAGLEAALVRLVDGMAADQRTVDMAAGPLDEAVRDLRMLPLAQATTGLERAARDLAVSEGKEVELRVEGGAVELDRTILEAVRDALLHLVRNAVAHGIEPPAARRAAGKPPRGLVRVTASLHGGAVEIAVRDDGLGLDLDAIRARAQALGLRVPADPASVARLVFKPGFSTAGRVTEVAGRGVGLDVVQERMAAVHGTVDACVDGGGGATFLLTVPLTLTALRVVLAEAGGHVYAIPGRSVCAVARVERDAVRAVAGRPVVRVGDTSLPLGSLAALTGGVAQESDDTRPVVVVVEAGARRVAVAVDALVAEQEVVIRSLGPRLRRVPGIAGATLLPDGRVALLLHPPDLVDAVLGGAATESVQATLPPTRPRRVLVVDDSITTRTLVRLILEGAGFEVRMAADGEEAWALLRDEPVDVVVSDVQMPRADGIELTRRIRANPRLSALPVVLLTALGSDADRTRGLEAGASAYLVKEAFDAEVLIEAVQRR